MVDDDLIMYKGRKTGLKLIRLCQPYLVGRLRVKEIYLIIVCNDHNSGIGCCLYFGHRIYKKIKKNSQKNLFDTNLTICYETLYAEKCKEISIKNEFLVSEKTRFELERRNSYQVNDKLNVLKSSLNRYENLYVQKCAEIEDKKKFGVTEINQLKLKLKNRNQAHDKLEAEFKKISYSLTYTKRDLDQFSNEVKAVNSENNDLLKKNENQKTELNSLLNCRKKDMTDLKAQQIMHAKEQKKWKSVPQKTNESLECPICFENVRIFLKIIFQPNSKRGYTTCNVFAPFFQICIISSSSVLIGLIWKRSRLLPKLIVLIGG